MRPTDRKEEEREREREMANGTGGHHFWPPLAIGKCNGPFHRHGEGLLFWMAGFWMAGVSVCVCVTSLFVLADGWQLHTIVHEWMGQCSMGAEQMRAE